MKKRFRLPIGELFNFFNITEYNKEIIINRHLKINTPNGYVQINFLIKKQGNVYNYLFNDNTSLSCDENHLIKNNNKFLFIKNAEFVDTLHSVKYIIKKDFLYYGDVFDLNIKSPHEYLTSSNIVCHNTSMARILCDKIDCDYMYINASDERGIDVMRDKITGFASTKSFKKLKIIVLDECDNITGDAAKAFKVILEDFYKRTRFILMSNHHDRIYEPILSRVQQFEFKPSNMESVVKRCEYILQKEKIGYKKEDIEKIVKISYPDLRAIIGYLQRFTVDCIDDEFERRIELSKELLLETQYQKIIIQLLKIGGTEGINKLRKLLTNLYSVDYKNLYKYLFEHSVEYAKSVTKETEILLEIAEFLYRDSFIIDKSINFMACMIKIVKINDAR